MYSTRPVGDSKQFKLPKLTLKSNQEKNPTNFIVSEYESLICARDKWPKQV